MTDPRGIVGIIANPASGKDVRRLVARASVFDNQEKQAIVGRLLKGLSTVGVRHVAYMDDTHGIVSGAIERALLESELDGVTCTPVSATRTVSALDTETAASAMRELGCAVVITLGGDGTNRAVAKRWPDAPLLPISTGTNNVFPRFVEATVAGAAAGLVATGQVPLFKVARQRKLVRISIADEADDIALIDAVLSRERFVGARALLAPEHLAAALLTRADPAAVGMTAIGGLIEPLRHRRNAGLWLELGPGGVLVEAPIAPGYYQPIAVRDHRRTRLGEAVIVAGPGVLAFDGERERVLHEGQTAVMRVERSGPWVIDVRRALRRAARQGLFARMKPAEPAPTGDQAHADE
ncbi:MAG: NAD(+)/NADH kinase [Pseudomonadales bacterium]